MLQVRQDFIMFEDSQKCQKCLVYYNFVTTLYQYYVTMLVLDKWMLSYRSRLLAQHVNQALHSF